MASKIAGIYYEVDYKINPQGFQKANDNIKRIDGNAKGAANQIGFLDKGMGSLIGKAAGIASIGYAFKKSFDFVKSSINTYIEFDDSLRKTASKINLTDIEMKSLAKSTGEVALQFNTTGKAVSDAQEYLALAGYNLEQIQAASPTVIAAQRATGESMQLVSDIATDTAGSYGYMADQLDYVTDRMVYTTTRFNTNFGQMGEAMKYVAPVAKNLGLEFSDLNAYIGTVANSGIKSSQAGTSLRFIFNRLKTPTKRLANQLKKEFGLSFYDKKGNFIGINESLLMIDKAQKKMSDKKRSRLFHTLFGTEASTAAEILFSAGIDNILKKGQEIEEESERMTQKTAEFIDAGLGGATKQFKSQMDGLSKELGIMFQPAATSLVEASSLLISGVRKNIQEINDNEYGATQKTFNESMEFLDSISGGILGTGIKDIVEMVDFIKDENGRIQIKENNFLMPRKIADAALLDDYMEKYLTPEQLEEVKKNRNKLKLFGGETEEEIITNYFDISRALKNNGSEKEFTKPVIELNININGGQFKDKENIDLLSTNIKEEFQKMIDTSWNKKLSMEDLLINGR